METFKESFCRRYACPPEHFVRRALLHCFYPHARVVVPLLYAIHARTVVESVNFLEEAGACSSSEDMAEAVKDYRYRLRYHGTFLARTFRWRVSGSAVLRLHARLAQNKSAARARQADPFRATHPVEQAAE